MEKLKALREGDRLGFSYCAEPKCPHCGEDYSIRDNEAWNLFDENDRHGVKCPSCKQPFTVSSHADWKFSTDEQEDD